MSSSSSSSNTMRAYVFQAPNKMAIVHKPIPTPGPNEALIKVTTTTVCGTDIHTMKGEIPVKVGTTIGHEPVGVVVKLGPGVTGFNIGQRVISSAITLCGHCNDCLSGNMQCGGVAGGAFKYGSTIEGVQAEYAIVPDAMVNMCAVPDKLTDEQVLLCCDIMSTGFSGAESGNVKIGDVVVVFAQGPVGLCATVGAKLRGAALIIAVDGVDERLAISKKLGADIVINFKKTNPVTEVMRLTNGRGADVAIEALGTPITFDNALKCIKNGGIVSSVGVYSKDLAIPVADFGAGLGEKKIVSTLCPGGQERMRRLMKVIETGRVDLTPMITHRFPFSKIAEAYDLFAHQRDGVMKIAIHMDEDSSPKNRSSM